MEIDNDSQILEKAIEPVISSSELSNEQIIEKLEKEKKKGFFQKITPCKTRVLTDFIIYEKSCQVFLTKFKLFLR